MRNLLCAMLNGKQKSISSTLRQYPYWAGVFVAMFIALFMTSCNDEDLAKAAHGVWTTGELVEIDDDGEPINYCTTYIFKYNPNAKYDGGTFVEMCEFTTHPEHDDLITEFSATVTISGRWEIIYGDMVLTYNLSSLDVAVDNYDVTLSDDADYSTYLWYEEMHSKMKREMPEEHRKATYQMFYTDYQENNEQRCENLSIDHGFMSYDTDEGREVLTKVRDDD